MATLANISNRNNFNIFRLIFAIFVLITHSFVLSGNAIKEPLGLLTNGQINFSYVGLRGFFTISGFLIFQSYERSSSGLEFMWKRILRILPGLFAISALTIFIVCPLISSYPIDLYFSDNNNYYLFFESIDPLFQRNIHASASGVFKTNVYTDQINGSLWTISYEFLFYVGFLFLFIKKNKVVQFIAISLAVVFLIFFKLRYLDPWFKYDIYIYNTKFLVKALVDFLMFFSLGAFCGVLRYDKLSKKTHQRIVGSSIVIIIALIRLSLFNNFYLYLLVPLILSIGLLNIGKYDITVKIGDISYGIYLASFFIQQLLMSIYLFGPYTLLFFSLSLSIIYGLFSWNYIEKPFLLYKGVFKKSERW